MKKSKRQIKKELKAEMKGKLKTKIKKKFRKFKVILIIVLTLTAVIAAIKAVLAFIESRHKKDPKREGLKDVTAFFASKTWNLSEPVKAGFLVGNYFSNLNLDLSNCKFEDNSFIAIKSGVGRVCLTLPENVNIKYDGIGSVYYLKQEYNTEEFDESLPTVYVALKAAFSAVFISKAAPCEVVDAEVEEVKVEG